MMIKNFLLEKLRNIDSALFASFRFSDDRSSVCYLFDREVYCIAYA